jgi:hypothetical protein
MQILVYSGNADARTHRQMLDAGADQYVVKTGRTDRCSTDWNGQPPDYRRYPGNANTKSRPRGRLAARRFGRVPPVRIGRVNRAVTQEQFGRSVLVSFAGQAGSRDARWRIQRSVRKRSPGLAIAFGCASQSVHSHIPRLFRVTGSCRWLGQGRGCGFGGEPIGLVWAGPARLSEPGHAVDLEWLALLAVGE